MKFSFDSVAHLYKEVYYNLPQPVKTVIGSLYGAIPLEKRFGSLYSEYREIFEQFEVEDQALKEEYLYNKIRETLEFAEAYIPFYQKRFAEYGVRAADFLALGDLKKFPTMTKADIKEHIESMYTEVRERAVAYYSGGSTSSPTKFYHPLFTSRAKHKAYSLYTLSKVGYRYRDRTLLLKGRESVDLKRNIYWDYEPVDNFLNISSRYIMSEKFSYIYKAARKFRPKFIFGYPSAVMDFMFATKAAGLQPLQIQGIILASETVFDTQIEMLKNFYGDVPVFIDYGHTERAVGAYRLDFGPYNFVGPYGVARAVDGEIVGTSLDNFVMPYINYKTSDEVSGEIAYYRDSDIMMTAQRVKGRAQDYLVTYDHRLIPLTTLYVGHHLPADVILNLQYRQDEPGRVTVLLERGRGSVDENEIVSGLKAMVKEGIFFDVKLVNEIPRTDRGKRVICQQLLDIEEIRKEQGQKILTRHKIDHDDRRKATIS